LAVCCSSAANAVDAHRGLRASETPNSAGVIWRRSIGTQPDLAIDGRSDMRSVQVQNHLHFHKFRRCVLMATSQAWAQAECNALLKDATRSAHYAVRRQLTQLRVAAISVTFGKIRAVTSLVQSGVRQRWADLEL
jgi:hypothetical protein